MLPKPERLSKDSEIKATLKAKHYTSKSPLLSLVGRANREACSRVVVVTPKKLGNACKRNRIRRVFSAAYSKIRLNIAKNVDLVLFPKKIDGEPSLAMATKELSKCLNFCSLYTEN